MYKNVLKGINVLQNCATEISTEPVPEDEKESPSEDEKSNSPFEETAMDYANKTHDFSKISEEDMFAAFDLLRQRCPKSWTKALENRAMSFHRKIITLRKE